MSAPLPTASLTTTLDQLGIGATAQVIGVGGAMAVRRRLLEMGLCQGVTVELLRRAPLGDPLEVRVRGYLLSLRAEQAALITLTTTSTAA